MKMKWNEMKYFQLHFQSGSFALSLNTLLLLHCYESWASRPHPVSSSILVCWSLLERKMLLLTANKTRRTNESNFVHWRCMIVIVVPTYHPLLHLLFFFLLFFAFIFYPSYFIHMRLFTVEPWYSDHLRVSDVVFPFFHHFIELRLQAWVEDCRVVRETPPQRLLLLQLLLLLLYLL